VNKIPINLHYTINPMRGPPAQSVLDIPTLFPRDRSARERAAIWRTAKHRAALLPPRVVMLAPRRSLYIPEYAAERGDREAIDRFSVSFAGYIERAGAHPPAARESTGRCSTMVSLHFIRDKLAR